ncbi:MAG TPA: multicopper oxidase domain-containing protein [Ilumatobacteraceae bacterium]|nr:multicopper oxidase domain-containing protein [Ilumatobacteraceae bacterium]
MSNEKPSFLSGGAFIFAAIAFLFAGFAILKASNDDGDGKALTDSGGAVPTVDISLTEFAMSPAMPTVPEGKVTLRVTNNGTLVHNLAFSEGGITTRDLQPGESQTISVDAKGEMNFLCTIPGHSASGMTGHVMADPNATDVVIDDPMASMTWEEMDEAMAARGWRFVEEPKGTFGGQELEPTILADGTKQFELTASIIDWEVEPGKIVKAWTYNEMVPGPTMRADVGDKIRVILHNELPESTTIHWHGMRVPNSMDGVDPYTQSPIKPGESFTYEFEAVEPAVGMYHSHHNAQTQVPNGLMGAFYIGDMPIPDSLAEKGMTKVDQEITMVLNDAGTIGLTLNGKSFPATQLYTAKLGDTVMVHYFNEGLTSHPMHLHQPVGWIIARDGHPLEVPIPSDTINVAPGERITVLYHMEDPGVWAWHCHILNHAEGPLGMFGMVTAIIVEE